jgi:DNA-binding NarL/FixJ family response regulator
VLLDRPATAGTNSGPTDWVHAAVVTRDEFMANLLVHTLQVYGIITMARSAHPSADASRAGTPVEVLVRFISIEDGQVDPAELHAARAARPNIGLVVLTLARDIRLLGLTMESLPLGTLTVSIHDAGSMTRLADVTRSAARRPLAERQQLTRLPLSDEQIAALRAVAAGLSNEQLAAERSTTVSAARQLVNRTARSLGIPPKISPSQMRALLGVSHTLLLSGASPPLRQMIATLESHRSGSSSP